MIDDYIKDLTAPWNPTVEDIQQLVSTYQEEVMLYELAHLSRRANPRDVFQLSSGGVVRWTGEEWEYL